MSSIEIQPMMVTTVTTNLDRNTFFLSQENMNHGDKTNHRGLVGDDIYMKHEMM